MIQSSSPLTVFLSDVVLMPRVDCVLPVSLRMLLILAEGLADLGLIESPQDLSGLRRFFMHGTSHYLGLDVHDVGAGGPMDAGTVITVEPGIYLPRWGGVRIEDLILVTRHGGETLCRSPKRLIEV